MLMTLGFLVLLFWVSRIPQFRADALRLLPEHRQSLGQNPRVSLVVAARDESAGIAASVRSLLAQDWPNLELIVVDDRSTDGTSEILDHLAQDFPQLQVVHNKALPAGWLGKCWALACGAQRATGEWLIFCDGDVVMQAHTVRSAVNTCVAEKIDHISLAPRIINQSFWQDAVVASLSFLFYLFQDPRHIFDREKIHAYMGVGAFNMVRRELYEAMGGHEALRLEVVDDVFLGMLVKRGGGRSGFFLGQNLASIEWYASLPQYIRGMEKNSFAGLRFSWGLLFLAMAGQTLLFFVPPIAALVTKGWQSLPWVLAVGVAHGLFIQSCRRQAVVWNRGLTLIPSILIQFFAFCRSAWITSRQGGVMWRGTFYPLQELKAAQARLRGPLIFWFKRRRPPHSDP